MGKMKKIKSLMASVFLGGSMQALALNVGDKAPTFQLKNQNGETFALAPSKNWTVLYFYPKADTPGCTKQACAFRDSIKKVTEKNAIVYGVSTDAVPALKAFKDKYHLNFDLLSDEKGDVSKAYGTSMPLVTISRRHTFIIDPELVVRYIDRDVDPALDAQKVAETLEGLQTSTVKTK